MFGKLFSGLFGGGSGSGASATRHQGIEHKGYTITPAPLQRDGQWQLAGTITKPAEDGSLREHRLIRADLMPSEDAAVEFCIRKGKQVIDEQGDGIFN